MPRTSIRKRTESAKLWIVAGPNGSGKTTALSNAIITDFKTSFWIINPDFLSKEISSKEGLSPNEANLQAVIRIGEWLRSSVRAYQTVGVETVLSTSKYRSLVRDAKRRGFEVVLFYVVLDSPERNVERVKMRVRKGGHNVPANKVRSRYFRSLKQLPWFFEQADYAFVFDNSGAKPVQVAWKKHDRVDIVKTAPQCIHQALASVRKRNSK